MAQPTLDVFGVIADSSRRQMLQLLSKDSLTINSLAENLTLADLLFPNMLKYFTRQDLFLFGHRQGKILHAETRRIQRVAAMDRLL